MQTSNIPIRMSTKKKSCPVIGEWSREERDRLSREERNPWTHSDSYFMAAAISLSRHTTSSSWWSIYPSRESIGCSIWDIFRLNCCTSCTLRKIKDVASDHRKTKLHLGEDLYAGKLKQTIQYYHTFTFFMVWNHISTLS